jgi:hypothetical protein
MEEKWTPFLLDSLYVFALIDSKTTWINVIKTKFGDNFKRLKSFKSDSMQSDRPRFGEGARFTNQPTLGEWAEKQGMDLSL